MGGGLPAAEVIAALAITAVAVLVVRSQSSGRAPALGFCGALIATAVAVHAMLHGLEAPAGRLRCAVVAGSLRSLAAGEWRQRPAAGALLPSVGA